MEKIFKILLFAILLVMIASGALILFIIKVANAQTIGIGVMPSIVKFSRPGNYSYEFCFFNEGDTNATYEIISGEVRVQYISFLVPARNNITSCVRKIINLTVTEPGYFYVVGKPATSTNESYPVSVVRRVGVKVELMNYTQTTTTTIAQTTTTTIAGGGGTTQTTTTTIQPNRTTTTIVQTNRTTTTTTIRSGATNQTTTTIKTNPPNITEIIEKLRSEKEGENRFSIADVFKIVITIGVIAGFIYLILYIIQII